MSSEEGVRVEKHAAYFRLCLNGLPQHYEQLDTSRMTIVLFGVSGLALLGKLEGLGEERRREIVQWIYRQQVGSSEGGAEGRAGWRGWAAGGGWECGQLALTYAALASLLVLGDDLGGVRRAEVLESVAAAQCPDGSFRAHPEDSEADVRFVYCAVAVCRLLGDLRPLRTPALLAFLRRCLNRDGGFGQRPGCESHGGSTYCAVASLSLLGLLDHQSPSQPSEPMEDTSGGHKAQAQSSASPGSEGSSGRVRATDAGVGRRSGGWLSSGERRRLRRWLALRQSVGFHGRPNKPDDSCYSFWIPAALALLGCLEDSVDVERAREFTLTCQQPLSGGMGKFSDSHADALHSYLGLAGLSLLRTPRLAALHPALNLPAAVARALPPSHPPVL